MVEVNSAADQSLADTSPSKSKSSRPPKFQAALARMYGSIGMMLWPFDQPCATAIMENAERCAESLDQLARENKTVERVLTKAMEGTAWTSVLAAHTPVVMAIAGHHGADISKLFQRETTQQNTTEDVNDTDLSGSQSEGPDSR